MLQGKSERRYKYTEGMKPCRRQGDERWTLRVGGWQGKMDETERKNDGKNTDVGIPLHLNCNFINFHFVFGMLEKVHLHMDTIYFRCSMLEPNCSPQISHCHGYCIHTSPYQRWCRWRSNYSRCKSWACSSTWSTADFIFSIQYWYNV